MAWAFEIGSWAAEAHGRRSAGFPSKATARCRMSPPCGWMLGFSPRPYGLGGRTRDRHRTWRRLRSLHIGKTLRGVECLRYLVLSREGYTESNRCQTSWTLLKDWSIPHRPQELWWQHYERHNPGVRPGHRAQPHCAIALLGKPNASLYVHLIDEARSIRARHVTC